MKKMILAVMLISSTSFAARFNQGAIIEMRSNSAPGTCLAGANGSYAGAILVQNYSCGSYDSAMILTDMGDGYFKISPLANQGLCLDAVRVDAYGNKDYNSNNITITLQSCDNNGIYGGQEFNFEGLGGDNYCVARPNGLVLDVQNAQGQAGQAGSGIQQLMQKYEINETFTIYNR